MLPKITVERIFFDESALTYKTVSAQLADHFTVGSFLFFKLVFHDNSWAESESILNGIHSLHITSTFKWNANSQASLDRNPLYGTLQRSSLSLQPKTFLEIKVLNIGYLNRDEQSALFLQVESPLPPSPTRNLLQLTFHIKKDLSLPWHHQFLPLKIGDSSSFSYLCDDILSDLSFSSHPKHSEDTQFADSQSLVHSLSFPFSTVSITLHLKDASKGRACL